MSQFVCCSVCANDQILLYRCADQQFCSLDCAVKFLLEREALRDNCDD